MSSWFSLLHDRLQKHEAQSIWVSSLYVLLRCDSVATTFISTCHHTPVTLSFAAHFLNATRTIVVQHPSLRVGGFSHSPLPSKAKVNLSRTILRRTPGSKDRLHRAVAQRFRVPTSSVRASLKMASTTPDKCAGFGLKWVSRVNGDNAWWDKGLSEGRATCYRVTSPESTV